MTRTGLGANLPAEAQAKYQGHINGATQVNGALGTQATIAFTHFNDAEGYLQGSNNLRHVRMGD